MKTTRAISAGRGLARAATAAFLAICASPALAEGGSAFLGEWCGIETRLWVGPDHIGFNEHTVCTPRRDPAAARPASFSTRVSCRNLYVEGEGEALRLIEVPIASMSFMTLTLTDPDTLHIDLDDGTAPDVFVRCP